ncbi:hypothetical protein SDC9_88677 [bioreactor metagenome]|uniref:Uncharacterized protein n=1 Tax=bioreactor metagenome TaxID=1076179 RepID=A0A644ZM85_9ZZZZ
MQTRNREQMGNARVAKFVHHLVVNLRNIAKDHALCLAGRVGKEPGDTIADSPTQLQQRAVGIRRCLPNNLRRALCKGGGKDRAIAVVQPIFFGGWDDARIRRDDLPVFRRSGKNGKEPQSTGDGRSIQRCIG